MEGSTKMSSNIPKGKADVDLQRQRTQTENPQDERQWVEQEQVVPDEFPSNHEDEFHEDEAF